MARSLLPTNRLPAVVLTLVLLIAGACAGSEPELADRATPTAVPAPTTTAQPTPTSLIIPNTAIPTPTATPVTPTATPVPATPTVVQPTATAVQPTATAIPPTSTAVQPTATPAQPTPTPTTTPGGVTIGCRIDPQRPVAVGEILTFTALQNPTDINVSFVFDHGDGTLDPRAVSQAFYEAPGSYDVTLRWSHSAGSGTTFCGEVVVIPSGTAVLSITALAGPICPVDTDPPRPECAPRPVDGAVMIVTDAAGVEVTRGTTGPDGKLALAVQPGTLTVVPQPVTGLLGTASPTTVTVAADQTLAITLDYDTGIR